MTFLAFQIYRKIMQPVVELRKFFEKLYSPRPPCDCMACEIEMIDRDLGANPQMIFSASMVAVCIILALFMLIGGCQQAAHAEVPEQKAIQCVIGEAENQGFVGMLALSHALHNRGTLKGCYGYKSPRVIHHLYSHNIYLMAKRAWEQSANEYDMTRGATGWGNAEDLEKFEKCKWWRNCTITFMYKDHYFYKGIISKAMTNA